MSRDDGVSALHSKVVLQVNFFALCRTRAHKYFEPFFVFQYIRLADSLGIALSSIFFLTNPYPYIKIFIGTFFAPVFTDKTNF